MDEQEPLFTVSNHHLSGSEHPRITDPEPGYYRGYFENAHGDQIIFLHNTATNQSDLFVGDAEWKRFPVINGRVEELTLNEEELTWLRSCWRATNVSSSM